MDDADITGERAEQYHQEALAKSRKPAAPAPTGRCFYCDEIVGDDQRWCDAEHRNLYEQEQRRLARGRA